MPTPKTNKGLSIQLNFGTYGGFYTKVSKQHFRICAGWVAFTMYFYDIEDAILKKVRSKECCKEERDRIFNKVIEDVADYHGLLHLNQLLDVCKGIENIEFTDWDAEVRKEERERILKHLKTIPTIKNGTLEIVGGLYTDEKMRCPNVERIELINRYAVQKAITNDRNTYNL